VFPGVEGDLKGMTAPCRGGFGDDPQAGAALFGSVWCFFDLPFSFLADTVCLPYDLYKVSCGGKTRSGVARDAHKVEE
jgi:hypothetical protein